MDTEIQRFKEAVEAVIAMLRRNKHLTSDEEDAITAETGRVRSGAPFNAVGGVLRPRMMPRRRRLVVSEICRHRARQDPTSRYRIHPRRARSHRAKASAMTRHGRQYFRGGRANANPLCR